jgi:Flp pilus assembly secretin CpaC
MPRPRTCVIVLVLFLTTISVACAANQTITLRLDAPTALAIERPFKTVLIGDPNIVHVHTLNDRRVLRRVQAEVRTHLTHRPARDIFPRRVNLGKGKLLA